MDAVAAFALTARPSDTKSLTSPIALELTCRSRAPPTTLTAATRVLAPLASHRARARLSYIHIENVKLTGFHATGAARFTTLTSSFALTSLAAASTPASAPALCPKITHPAASVSPSRLFARNPRIAIRTLSPCLANSAALYALNSSSKSIA